MNTNRWSGRTLSILSLFILLITASITYSVRVSAGPVAEPRFAPRLAHLEQTGADILVAGSYLGVVRVSEPAPLGALDLVFDVLNNGGALSGQVNEVRTQVFLGGPSFTGSVNASAGITPTFRLVSERFESVISGRTVERQFTLTGEVLNMGDVLRGDYVETIVGFKPEPMEVIGGFIVTRPGGLTNVIDIPSPGNPATPTPTATAPAPGNPPTATPTPTRPEQNNPPTPTLTPTPTATTPGNGDGGSDGGQGGSTSIVFLPVVANRAESVRSADVMDAQRTPTPTPRGGTAELPPTPTPTDDGGTSTLPPVDGHAVYLPFIGK